MVDLSTSFHLKYGYKCSLIKQQCTTVLLKSFRKNTSELIRNRVKRTEKETLLIFYYFVKYIANKTAAPIYLNFTRNITHQIKLGASLIDRGPCCSNSFLKLENVLCF